MFEEEDEDEHNEKWRSLRCVAYVPLHLELEKIFHEPNCKLLLLALPNGFLNIEFNFFVRFSLERVSHTIPCKLFAWWPWLGSAAVSKRKNGKEFPGDSRMLPKTECQVLAFAEWKLMWNIVVFHRCCKWNNSTFNFFLFFVFSSIWLSASVLRVANREYCDDTNLPFVVLLQLWL